MSDAIAGLSQAADCPDERRRHQRRTVLLRARLYQKGEVVDCIVNNLSAGGAGLLLEVRLMQAQMDMQVGAVVTLTIERYGDLPGEIAWHEKQYAGIRFFQDPEQVRQLTETLLPPED
jgi:hypothetical protein